MKPFIALRRRWYRWFLGARAMSSGGFRIREVARNWLVYSLTGSALALGWVDTAWGVATFLLSLVGGTASDRLDRRKVVILGEAGSAIIPLVVAFLVFGGMIRVWHLVLANFCMAIIFSFVLPARRALLADLISKRALMNALALSSVAMSLIGIIFSAGGGTLVDVAGPVTAYLLVAGCLGLATWMYSKLPSVAKEEKEKGQGAIRTALVEGSNYILERPVLAGILALDVGCVLLYQPYGILLPLFAGDVFEVGATGFGFLQSASSVGGMVGSLVVASLGDFRYKGRLLIGAGILSGVGLLVLGWAPTFAVGLLSLVLVNIGGTAYMVARDTLLQSMSSREMRGRIEGFRRLIWGLRPLGVLPMGILADAVGAPLTATLEGMAVILLFVVGGLLQSRLRQR